LVGEAADGSAALELIGSLHPHVEYGKDSLLGQPFGQQQT
jgi:hypothetical protein